MPLNNQEKLILKEILYNSLAQAVIRLTQKSHFSIKLCLLLFIIFSNALAAFYIIDSIFSYLNYEVVTTMRTIYETSTLFPKVTICNRNRYQTKFSFEFLSELSKNLNENIKVFDEEQTNRFNYSFKTDLMDKVLFKANGIIRNNFSDFKRQKLGHSLADILMNCTYDAIKCSANEFSWSYDAYFGNCFEFNSGKKIYEVKYCRYIKWITLKNLHKF